MGISSWSSLHYVPAAQRENRGLYVTVQELPWADLGPKDADCGLKATWRERSSCVTSVQSRAPAATPIPLPHLVVSTVRSVPRMSYAIHNGIRRC